MIILGLTGSIGMGKSTTGAMLRNLGICVHDADRAVHALLAPGGRAVQAVCAAFPFCEFPQIYGEKDQDGCKPLKRKELSTLIFADDEQRKTLEGILHPLVREAQNEFIHTKKALGEKIIALDIPLLFETGGEDFVDYTITVSAPASVQKERVLNRPGMNLKKFNQILDHQMSDSEKCLRSDFVIQTGLGKAHTIKELKTMLKQIKEKSIII